jgi:tetratricopeptide (TPR) repeat protein
MVRARIRYRAIWACYQRADLDGADQLIREFRVLNDAVGLPELGYEYALLTAGRLLLAGDTGLAEVENDAMLQKGTAANVPEVLASYGGLLYAIREHQGRLDEIADFFLDAARENPSIAALRSAAILLCCELDRVDEARERLAAEAARDFDFPYDTIWIAAMANLLDAAANLGDRAAARTLVDRLTPIATQLIVPSVVVNGTLARPLARCVALFGEYDQAEAWFAHAHRIHARLQAPFWSARAQLDHADLCLARRADGDVDRARDLAASAAAIAAEYGCAGLTTRAAALLRGL